jgi:hypothetical protein
MHPVAHHASQDTLTPLLLLDGAGLSLLAAYGQAWLAGTRDRLARNRHHGAS